MSDLCSKRSYYRKTYHFAYIRDCDKIFFTKSLPLLQKVVRKGGGVSSRTMVTEPLTKGSSDRPPVSPKPDVIPQVGKV